MGEDVRQEAVNPWSKPQLVRLLKDAIRDEAEAQNRYSKLMEGICDCCREEDYNMVAAELAEIYNDELNHMGTLMKLLAVTCPDEYKIINGGILGMEVEEAQAMPSDVHLPQEAEEAKAEAAAETVEKAADEVMHILSDITTNHTGDVTAMIKTPDVAVAEVQEVKEDKIEEILAIVASKVKHKKEKASAPSRYRAD